MIRGETRVSDKGEERVSDKGEERVSDKGEERVSDKGEERVSDKGEALPRWNTGRASKHDSNLLEGEGVEDTITAHSAYSP